MDKKIRFEAPEFIDDEQAAHLEKLGLTVSSADSDGQPLSVFVFDPALCRHLAAHSVKVQL